MAQGKSTPAATKERIEERIPVAVAKTGINAYATDVVSNYQALISNGIVENYSNDDSRYYVTQRPSLNIFREASNDVADVYGRGIHYWSSNSNLYWMNDDVIYKGSYSTPCSVQGGDTAIASGSSQVHFREWSSANADYLFIFDSQNAGIYCICSDADTTVINILDRTTSGTGGTNGFATGDDYDFSPLVSIIGTDGLCEGAVVLDTYLFLGTTTSARIYNSDADNWLQWDALNFTTAERDNDELLSIEKTQDHLAAFGARTIELFYDNANATGSPLSVRTDVAHQIGTAFRQSTWSNGDDIYFLGVRPGGEFVMATLRNFQVEEHRNNTYNSFLWMARYTENLTIQMGGFSVGGHVYAIMTMFDGLTSVKSVVYDAAYDYWYEWSTTIGTNTNFVVMGYTYRDWNDDNRPSGILRTGDIFYINGDYTCVDSISQVGNTETENITMTIITDDYDYNSTENKYMVAANYVGNQTAATQTMTVYWYDEDAATEYSRTIDTSYRGQINRMGRFVKRKFKFVYAGTEQLRFEGLDVVFTLGNY